MALHFSHDRLSTRHTRLDKTQLRYKKLHSWILSTPVIGNNTSKLHVYQQPSSNRYPTIHIYRYSFEMQTIELMHIESSSTYAQNRSMPRAYAQKLPIPTNTMQCDAEHIRTPIQTLSIKLHQHAARIPEPE